MKRARKPSVGPNKRVTVHSQPKVPVETFKTTVPDKSREAPVEMVSPEIIRTTMESFKAAIDDLVEYYNSQIDIMSSRLDKIAKDIVS